MLESYPSFPTYNQLVVCFFLKVLKVDIPIDFYKEALWAWQKINCSSPKKG